MLPIDYHLHILAVAGDLRIEGLLFRSASKMLCVFSWSFDLCELQTAVGSRPQKSLWGFSPGLGWDNKEMLGASILWPQSQNEDGVFFSWLGVSGFEALT